MKWKLSTIGFKFGKQSCGTCIIGVARFFTLPQSEAVGGCVRLHTVSSQLGGWYTSVTLATNKETLLSTSSRRTGFIHSSVLLSKSSRCFYEHDPCCTRTRSGALDRCGRELLQAQSAHRSRRWYHCWSKLSPLPCGSVPREPVLQVATFLRRIVSTITATIEVKSDSSHGNGNVAHVTMGRMRVGVGAMCGPHCV